MTFFSGTQKKNLKNLVQIVKVSVIQNNNIDGYCIAKKKKNYFNIYCFVVQNNECMND